MDYIAKARSVLDNEIAGLEQVRDELGDSFNELVDLCAKVIGGRGKIVITGVGKSGHVGHKMAATLASTGSPAVFMHPVEAMHGDLGIVCDGDLLLAISYSGETDELLQVLPSVKRFKKVPIVGLTSDPASNLAEYSDLLVQMRVPSEACPFNLAPTTSATATMAFGDALAMVLMAVHQFTKEDYSKHHPAGAIGRAITLRVGDVVRPPERTPIVKPDATVHDALLQMTKCRSGSVLVVDDDDMLVGFFTDGDFRRSIAEDLEVMHAPIQQVMTANPTTLVDSQMAVAILKLLEEKEFDDIPVVDEKGKAVGLIDIQDLPKFKMM